MWSLAGSRNVAQLRARLLWMLQQHDATVTLPNGQEVGSGGRCGSLWYPASLTSTRKIGKSALRAQRHATRSSFIGAYPRA